MAGETACVEYIGARNAQGYGVLPKAVNGSRLAHRAALAHALGRPVEGVVRHGCDNPPCINPDHLFLGTHHENMLDMAAKGRAQRWQAEKTHCPKGHAYDQANTYIYKNQRFCRACKSIHQANYLAKKKVSS